MYFSLTYGTTSITFHKQRSNRCAFNAPDAPNGIQICMIGFAMLPYKMVRDVWTLLLPQTSLRDWSRNNLLLFLKWSSTRYKYRVMTAFYHMALFYIFIHVVTNLLYHAQASFCSLCKITLCLSTYCGQPLVTIPSSGWGSYRTCILTITQMFTF